MKSILISIKPEWVAKILNGGKTIEIRKTCPKEHHYSFDVYIYCTKPRGSRWKAVHLIGRRLNSPDPCSSFLGDGKVVAKCKCLIGQMDFNNPKLGDGYADCILNDCCLTLEQARRYQGNRPTLKLWHISDLVIFSRPKKLSEFGLTRAPQSWQYVEVKR